MDKYCLEVGDLLLRNKDVGVVHSAQKTPYGVVYQIYWRWEDNKEGTVLIPQVLLCEPFFKKFTLVRKKCME